MIELLEEYGREDLAKVYVAALRDSKEYLIEFVESIQPPTPREKKVGINCIYTFWMSSWM